MNNITVFANQSLGQVRVVEKAGAPYFVLKDVCDALGISKHRDVAERLDLDEREPVRVDTLGGPQEMICVNESGLYNVILRSDKPQAKQFKKWITSEVLPSIRKRGAYMTDDALERAITDPDFLIRLATELKDERAMRYKMQDKIEQDRPKVIFADAVSASHTSILIGDLAKLIRQNGFEIGQNRLFDWLRDEGYLIKYGSSKNMPTQRAMDLRLFEVKETTISNADGSIRITKTTKVTGKGQQYFINKFLSGNMKGEDQ